MKIRVTLDEDEIKQAIIEYLDRRGGRSHTAPKVTLRYSADGGNTYYAIQHPSAIIEVDPNDLYAEGPYR